MSQESPLHPPPTRRQRRERGYSIPWLGPRDLHPLWDWERMFGRGGRVEVELGTGKGAWLSRAAAAHPEVNFAGVDYAGKYLGKAASRLSRENAQNVVLIYAKHEVILGELPPNSVDVFHIYFPDPWHKDSHAHRRWFLQPEMLQWVHAALKPGGEMRLRTDVPTYFERMLATLERFRAGFEIGEPIIYTQPPSPDWIMTNYEARFLKEGLPCHAVTVRKRAGGSRPSALDPRLRPAAPEGA
jgi:tRNA (guanine-N7-)-methyltransferase